MSIQVFGLPVSRGVAIGKAVLVASSRVDVAHYFIDEHDVEAEIARLRAARDRVAADFEGIKSHLPTDAPAELAALLDVHLMLLHDDMLAEATKHWVSDRHYNAEWALSAQLEVLARQFDEMEDPYLRERKADLEQVVERMLVALRRKPDGDGAAISPAVAARQAELLQAEAPLILVANDISPADMLQFKQSVFRGFVTDVGGKTSHTAIVARSLDIPAVVGAREASRLIAQDDWVVVDGDAGVVIVDPSPMVLEEYRFRQRQSELERERLSRLRRTPAVTLDGVRVDLLANIELPGDAAAALDTGAQGVGLYRSEFLFMNRDGDAPDEDEQYEAYRTAVLAMEGLPVTIRTLDIGADKPLGRAGGETRHHDHTLNPALGLRAIRWSLAEPAMFMAQLRAILRASAHGPVKLLIPMLAHEQEIRATLEAVARARDQLLAAGHVLPVVPVGAMIEVPAAALSLPLFTRCFDYLSIGTNDLIQYVLAIDRSDEGVAHLYDPWHPAVLRLVQDTIRCGQAAGKDVTVCGEMAGDVAFTRILLGMGLRSFSMHPAQIPSVKQAVLRADVQRLGPPVTEALETAWREGGEPARARLLALARPAASSHADAGARRLASAS